MADQWDPAAFGLSAPPTATSPSLGASPAVAGAPAQSGGGTWDPAAFGLQAAPPSAAADQSGNGGQNDGSLTPGTKTGYAATIAASAVRGGAGVLNVLSDPFGNLIGKPAGILLGAAHDALAPMFGGKKFTNEDRAALFGEDVPQIGTRIADAIGRAVDAPSPDTVQPGSLGQRLVGAGVEGAVGMLGMGVGGAVEGI